MTDIYRLFRNPEQALAIIGRGRMAAFREARRSDLSADLAMHDRIRMLDEELRGQLRLLADQIEEFDDTTVVERLEAEGLALLIALRELWRHFPDVFAGTREE